MGSRTLPRLCVGVGLLLLAACAEDVPRVCPNGASEPTSDTLIGARIDGRSFLVASTTPGTHSASVSSGYLDLLGYDTQNSPPQGLQVWIYGFHGVGSYPFKWASVGSVAGGVYWCGYEGAENPSIGYWSDGPDVPGDSVWITAWDSASGRLQGTFQFHGSQPTPAGTVPITKGAFNMRVTR